MKAQNTRPLPKFENTHPNFQKQLREIAEDCKREIDYVWRLWREYSDWCQNCDQSAILNEFSENYHAKLYGDNRVVVEVKGGVACVSLCPDDISVEIIDHDNH